MALGTTLSSVVDVSTTAGLHNFNSTTAGTAAIQAAVDSDGILTLCLMGYHHDYSDNAPTQDGDHTQIRVWYMEKGGAYRPHITVFQGAGTTDVYAEDSGTDDDSEVYNHTTDAGVSWATIRGDSTTTGTGFNAGFSNSNYGVFTIKFTGRGSDVVINNRRSYFAFDLSVITGTVDSGKFNFYLDNLGHTNDDFGKAVVVQATRLEGSTADYGNCFVVEAVAGNATFFGANF